MNYGYFPLIYTYKYPFIVCLALEVACASGYGDRVPGPSRRVDKYGCFSERVGLML